jgi:hypothetical protein
MSESMKQLTTDTEKTINRDEINRLSAFYEILIKIDQRVKRKKKYGNIRNTNSAN